jgi:hypothetical protein
MRRLRQVRGSVATMTTDAWGVGATRSSMDVVETPLDDVDVVEVDVVEVDVDVDDVEAIDEELGEALNPEIKAGINDGIESGDAMVSAEQSDDARDGTDRSLVGQGALPLDVRTGDPRVDAAVAALRDLDDLPVAEHAGIFTQVHRDLQDALLTLDQD